ncbi:MULTISPECIES: cyclic pyranopterin monophosphate synthase MoaC [Hymenobacter]|uniref:Cyclic pyranopterin monophosphate synthase n=1 Tax=Hymenobacter jejuensis TaxID=2502781 RepID=A0A5B7ZZN1_9BACT|nr:MULTISPECIES: cyclic pyranopterin monophosphate synthase MoaC [Hymenobacter]MBC6991308.1 cyclic pyranopterin monophosphate synthase MoaC [Hymenobacter sp. BT491]QDA60327.1 cyclic pyranopterin monophosphate synthase MoaC [Hymenobacter jejuensis]
MSDTSPNSKLTHLNAAGQPSMVDVGQKAVTRRVAKARSRVVLGAEILKLVQAGDLPSHKGPVFQTAILAGVMAAKKTADLIPLCHPLGLDDCQVRIEVTSHDTITIECTATVTGKTGVEMEALTGASVAALTVYDMCKALSHNILIQETRLIEKTGGKRDFHHVDE